MIDVVDLDTSALRARAQKELGSLLTEGASEDEEARAWALLVDLIEDENRSRVLSAEPSWAIEQRNQIARDLFDVFFRLGPLQSYLDDESVEEILVSGPRRGFVIYSGGAKEPIDPRLGSDEEARALLSRIVGRAGRRIDDASPAVDVRLPDGARLHAIMPPLVGCTTITIRRHRMVAQSLDDLVKLDTLTREAANFLRACVEAGTNILVAGGTASGKTTTLNALGRATPGTERVVTIEETAELRLAEILEDCIALETRAANIEGRGNVTIRELVRHALRMRPTRIIVGEVRGPEALDMLSAMNTGHDGSMGTIHANSARQALAKLRTYTLMAEEGLTAEVATEMIAETIDVVVHLQLISITGKRRVTQIAEVAGIEGGRVLTNDIFSTQDGRLMRTGIRPRFAERLAEAAFMPLRSYAGGAE